MTEINTAGLYRSIMRKENLFFRILIIEDNPDRIKILKSWLPEDVKIVVATSAGRALGVLQRDKGNVYAGILLDHDLQDQVVTDTDKDLSATDILNILIFNVSKEVPVLIHSMNPSDAPIMVNKLRKNGFDITRIPMSELNKSKLMEWIEEAREIWEDLQD